MLLYHPDGTHDLVSPATTAEADEIITRDGYLLRAVHYHGRNLMYIQDQDEATGENPRAAQMLARWGGTPVPTLKGTVILMNFRECGYEKNALEVLPIGSAIPGLHIHYGWHLAEQALVMSPFTFDGPLFVDQSIIEEHWGDDRMLSVENYVWSLMREELDMAFQIYNVDPTYFEQVGYDRRLTEDHRISRMLADRAAAGITMFTEIRDRAIALAKEQQHGDTL
jgi:hypothetical protein